MSSKSSKPLPGDSPDNRTPRTRLQASGVTEPPRIETGSTPVKFAPGLYIAATPIGNLRDITLRVLDALANADEVLAEDTRRARQLLNAYGIKAKVSPYHEHNGAKRRPEILKKLGNGEVIVLISDAGTPLISDPGWKLSHDAMEAGADVFPLPGASALLAGLVKSGLPSDRFLFEGFLPSKTGARVKVLKMLADIPATLIFYETGPRLGATLRAMAEVLGPDRQAAITRELTKLFEEAKRGTLQDLADAIETGGPPRGEIVLLVERGQEKETDLEAIDLALREKLSTLPTKQAANEVAAIFDLPKRDVYQRALAIKREEGTGA